MSKPIQLEVVANGQLVGFAWMTREVDGLHIDVTLEALPTDGKLHIQQLPKKLGGSRR
jgi:hypothetical protein